MELRVFETATLRFIRAVTSLRRRVLSTVLNITKTAFWTTTRIIFVSCLTEDKDGFALLAFLSLTTAFLAALGAFHGRGLTGHHHGLRTLLATHLAEFIDGHLKPAA